MKKIFLIAFIFLCFKSFGQYPVTQNLGNGSTLVQVPANGGFRALLINRTFTDTTAANLTNIKYYPFAQIGTTADSSIWFRDKNAAMWIKLAGSSGGASGTFWNLTGNYLTVTPINYGVGTISADNLPLKTSDVQRVILPSTGLAYLNDTLNTKVMTFNPTTKEWGYSAWLGSGGGGGSTDTTSLSNRINLKLNISDTSGMLTNYVNGVGYALLKTGQTVRVDSATLASYMVRRKDSASATNLNGYLTRTNVSSYAPLFGVGDNIFTSSRRINGKDYSFGMDSLSNFEIYDMSGSFTVSTSSLFTGTYHYLEVTPFVTRHATYGTGTDAEFYTSITAGKAFADINSAVGIKVSRFTLWGDSARYRFVDGNTGRTQDVFRIHNAKFTFETDSVYAPNISSGGVAADSVLVIASDGRIKKRNASAFGSGSQTWQQTLTTGSTLTGANTINGGDFNFTFGQMGLFTISQNNKASVSGANGTANVSPLTVTGGNGGSTSYSTGTVLGGNAGSIGITAGNGGDITGTPSTGVGGNGGSLNLLAGDGGLGTTNGGTAGNATLQGGTGGGGTAGGTAGYVAIKGGSAGSTGNADGGNIYLSPGIKNGSGLDGHIFLGLSPSATVRGAATIGSTTRGDSLFNIKDGGLYADRGVRFPNIPSGSKSDSLMVKNSTGIVKYINTSDFTFQQDTISIASFGAGGGQAGDTTSFSTSTIYGSFYNDGSDTLMVTNVRAVMNGGTNDTLGYKIVYNDTLNVDGTYIGIVPLTNTTTGENADYDLYPNATAPMKIPPGNWVWCKTPTVVAGRKPYFFSVTLLGYKKRK